MFTKHFFKILMSFIGMILVGVVILFVIGYYDDVTSKKPTTNQSFKTEAK